MMSLNPSYCMHSCLIPNHRNKVRYVKDGIFARDDGIMGTHMRKAVKVCMWKLL